MRYLKLTSLKIFKTTGHLKKFIFLSFPRSGVGTQLWTFQRPVSPRWSAEGCVPTPERGNNSRLFLKKSFLIVQVEIFQDDWSY
jgi:hypothetical protein